MVAEVLHSTGVQGMFREEEVLPSQLTSTLSELYSSIRTLHPVLPTAQLQTAQQSCLEWIQVVAQWYALSLSLSLMGGLYLAAFSLV